MITVSVHFEDGNILVSSINGTFEEASKYYLNNKFNFGDTEAHPEDKMVGVICVFQIHDDSGEIRETIEDGYKIIGDKNYAFAIKDDDKHYFTRDPMTNDDAFVRACGWAYTTYFRNYYECSNCDRTWTMNWYSTCNDECPNCGQKDVQPHRSEDIKALTD